MIAPHSRILIIGAGRWGSAFAIYLQKLGFEISLYCHSEKSANYIQENNASAYLTDYQFIFKPNLFTDINEAVSKQDLIFISTPTKYLYQQLETIKSIAVNIPLIGINKGIDINSLNLIPQIVKNFFPNHDYFQLGGPCFPIGLLGENSYAAETLAGINLDLAQKIQKLISSTRFRIYISEDLQGVALMGAIKNVYAIAAGIIDAIKLNDESKAILISRGLNEMRKIGMALNVMQSTIYGLSGLGDLILTCYGGSQSYNNHFGMLITSYKNNELINSNCELSIAEIIKKYQIKLPEGYYTTNSLYQIVKKHTIDAPIVEAIYQYLFENKDLTNLIKQLMNRPLTVE